MRTLILACGLLSVFAVCGHAFVCETPQAGGPCLHWSQGGATLRTLLGSSGAMLDNGTLNWDQNALNAANDWNMAGASFHYTVNFGGQAGDPCACPGPADANPVTFSDSACGGGFGDIVGETQNCYKIQTGELVNSSVFLNSNYAWNAYDGALRPPVNDARRVLLHEFGHVLGLAHPNDFGQNVVAIMNSRESDIDRLQSDDIAGIFSLYPNGSGSGGVSGASTGNGCAIATNGGEPSWPLWATVVAAALIATRHRR